MIRADRSARGVAATVCLIATVGTAFGGEAPLPPGVLGEVDGEPLGALEAASVALLLTGQQGGDIAGATVWTTAPGHSEDGRHRVVMVADLDGPTLVADDPGPDLLVVALGYAVSDRGEVGGRIAQGFRVPQGAQLEAVRSRGLKIATTLPLPDGRWSLRLLFRNAGTGRLLLCRTVLDLPPADSRRPWLQPPLAAEPEDGWVLGRASDLDRLPRVGPGGRLPTALPVVVPGRPLRLELRGTIAGAPVTARLVDALGRAVDEPTLELRPSTAGTLEALLVATDVLPGHYGLVLTVGSEGGGGSSQQIALAVVDRMPAPAATAVDPALADDVDRAAREVIAALERLAAGDEGEALRAVSSIERAVWRTAGVDGLRRLRQAEIDELRPLAQPTGTALLPVAVLYRGLAREYREPGEEPVSLHAWSLAADLADWLADAAGEPSLAAAVQVALARDHVLAGSEAFAVDLMRRALLHLPDEPEILLGLAVLEERRGHREEAMELLERCLRAAPESWEARLRLGVNMARTRRYNEGFRRLERVAADLAAPDWARSVAHQERARALVGAGRRDAALAAAREGRRQLPADQQLVVLEARLLDLVGDPRGAAATVAGFAPAADLLAPSPRMRYMSAPSVGIELWAEARRRAADALDDLARALAGGAENGPGQPSQPG